MQFRISLYRSCQSMINSDHDLLQGDPKKPEPINFIITPTKMKQNYSNFVHIVLQIPPQLKIWGVGVGGFKSGE